MSDYNKLKQHILKLKTDPSSFSPKDVEEAFFLILQGEVNDVQIATFLTLLSVHKLDRDPEVLFTCATVLKKLAIQVDWSQINAPLLDIVGTGGDGKNTFNVSTASSIVVAAAGGKVGKGGGRSSTSKSGSADFLESLGANITSLQPDQIPKILQEDDFCFIFAPQYHPLLRKVAHIRKNIPFPTVFNLLGPLVNMCSPKKMIMGVFSADLGELMAKTLDKLGVEEALVVHGDIGLDEISPIGTTTAWALSKGTINKQTISPADFGLPEHDLSLVAGGSSDENAEIFTKIANNDYKGPILDFILINAAALLKVGGLASSFEEGVQLAREAIESGKVKSTLDKYVKSSN
ncbi:putative anthranilate phosphoribosyl transferase [Conidiobolus coronatus NRRL 28638]|uniref:Anthranilate phosphoribosyltransferase n=1 Tax=Conidiobolus coronatus (strain ATCC 28846 / CBS 209.66 / NRRL 28638) TaxID=796925 RepID=A0A137NWK5_CONC2|nr:putative anthranilate phosphoribosyl transferase [Conidiobolus coronatus NRRL 28638]|eukprot:KXN67166.1 putative anthranilate phosphoribosyl transferase [Conidiobolus coronatus NRRL 28638]